MLNITTAKRKVLSTAKYCPPHVDYGMIHSTNYSKGFFYTS